MAAEGAMVVFVGAAGAGKDSLARLLAKHSDFRMFPSYTVRPMRAGEKQGNPYWFVSQREFDELRRDGRLFNDVEVGGHHYGLDLMKLREAQARGEKVMMHVTAPDARRLKRMFDRVILVLVKLPSVAEQRRRLAERGSSEEEIQRRLADTFVQEPGEEDMDLVLVNETGKLDEAFARLERFVQERLSGRDGATNGSG